MVRSDDIERESNNLESANKMKAKWEEFGWVLISMKDIWKTIYGKKSKEK